MELVPLLQWLLLLAGVWVVGLPLAHRLFAGFPYGGVTLALPGSLAVASLVAYWVGKVDATLGFATGMLVVVALAVHGFRQGERPRIRQLRAPLVVFATFFAAMLVVRLANPGIVPWGGEKFLDFSLLKAVLRADAFPPADPWFAGETVRYYYGGYLTSGFLTRMSGVEPRYAYNLLVPTYYAMLATAAFGLAAAIADRQGHSPPLAGAGAAFFAAASGTLATPARFLLGVFPDAVPRSVAEAVVGGIRAPFDDAFAAATDPMAWSYWLGRYVITDTPDVFPAWTFVNGDLRPHMMSAPFLVLAAALAFAYFETPQESRWRRRGLVFGVLPPLAGWLAVVNTWSFPIVIGLVFLAVTFAPANAGSLFGVDDRAVVERIREATKTPARRELARVFGGAVTAATVAGIGLAWVAPYVLFQTATGDGVGLFPPNSPIGQFMLVHGGFLTLFVVFLAVPVRRLLGERPAAGVLGVIVVGGALVAVSVAGYASVAAMLLVGLPAWVVARNRDDGFTTVLILAGVGLVGFAELAYLKVWPHDPNALRWNTIYKLYHAVWILWGMAAGVVVTALTERVRDAGADFELSSPGRFVRPAGTVLLVSVVVVGMAVFPAAAGGERIATVTDGETTLDGLAYVSDHHPDAAAAIAWLDDRPGTPTIVAAPGSSPYTWSNAPSSLTGVPTLLGWEHEKGYRGADVYEERRFHVRVLYEGNAETTLVIADRYDVEYVYVGPNERERYDVAGLAENPRLTVAFESGDVTVYTVER